MGFKDIFFKKDNEANHLNEISISKNTNSQHNSPSIDDYNVSSNNCQNFEELNMLIESGVSKIVLNSDVINDGKGNFDNGIRINVEELTIEGNNYSIDAKGLSTIFKISGKNITFKNIIFKNAVSKKNGGVINNSNASLNFFNCKFVNNYSKKEGGVIYNKKGLLTFKNCEFNENSADWDGGVIYNKKGLFKFYKCDFNNNFSKKEGNCIWSSYDVEIYESNFNQNSKNYLIFTNGEDSNLTIMSSSFFIDDGEIIFIKDGFCLLESSKFIANESEKEYLISNLNGHLNVKQSKFEPKDVIYNDGTLHIDLENSNNQSTNEFDNLTDSDDFKGFTYLDDLIQNSNNIKLEYDIILKEYEQKFFEGGIDLKGDNVTIDGQNHIIDAKGLSRIFYIMGENITLKNIIFKNGKYWKNYFDNEMNGGGAIYSIHDSSFSIINCKFENNNSRNSGGAICNKGHIKLIRNTEFIGNYVLNKGGVIFNKIHPIFLEDCLFEKNSSDVDGGVIYNIGSSLNLLKCQFINNSSENNGGSIHNESKNDINITNCVFQENNAIFGGVIYNKSNSLTLNNCEFRNNIAKEGGTIWCSDIYDSWVVENCIFEKNIARLLGGALLSLVRFNKKLFLNNSKFSGNSADNGGCIYTFGNFEINSCDFEKNYSKYNGGAINYFEENLVLKNCNFLNNSSKNNGGAIYGGIILQTQESSLFENCNFKFNHSKFGGAITNNGTICIKDSKFINNSAEEDYGVIFNNKSGRINLQSCIFKGDYKYIGMTIGDLNYSECDFESHHKKIVKKSSPDDYKQVKKTFKKWMSL